MKFQMKVQTYYKINFTLSHTSNFHRVMIGSYINKVCHALGWGWGKVEETEPNIYGNN